MQEPFLERENRATREYPYVEAERRNLGARAHVHEEIEIVLVRSGTVEATVGGRTVTLTEGAVLIVMPEEVHAYASRGESLSVLLKLYAAPELFLLRLGEAGTVPADSPYAGAFRLPIETVAAEDRTRAVGYPYAVAAEVNRLTAAILRYLSPVRITERAKKDLLAGREFLARFDEFLESSYRAPISLDLAAAEMHYSRYYFAHRFTEITGQTFLDYVTLFRLEKARAALESGANVLDTALECGFGSARSFHRAFRKHYGIAPVEVKHGGVI